MKIIPAVSLIFVFLFAIGAAAQTTVRVFAMSGDPSGFVDEADQSRADSVKDLTKALSKKKTFKVVEGNAEVSLAVAGRTYEMDGSNKINHVGVKLSVGDYSKLIVGSSVGIGGGWGRAAGDAADQIEKWVKANQSNLLHLPVPKPPDK